jgi:glutathione synthase/RimK-type ligase-like ATP-grasp enzyme
MASNTGSISAAGKSMTGRSGTKCFLITCQESFEKIKSKKTETRIMKKIGILFGMENTFPNAFIERVNSKGESGIIAEAVTIDKVVQAAPTEYAVIIDRISQDVPFYRAFLKNAAASGTAVINNPFWWSADEKFFNNALAEKIGVPVPKTVLIAFQATSREHFRNLIPEPGFSDGLGGDISVYWFPRLYETA